MFDLDAFIHADYEAPVHPRGILSPIWAMGPVEYELMAYRHQIHVPMMNELIMRPYSLDLAR